MAGDAVWAIVVAGGAGRRYGGAKQFELLGGRPVHAWGVEAARSVAEGVVLVVPEDGEAAPADPAGGPSGGRRGLSRAGGPAGGRRGLSGAGGEGPGSVWARQAPKVQLADLVVKGGATRAASVRAGLDAVPSDAAVVVVHDAARPLASPTLFREVVEAVRAGATGAVPGLPIADTVKQVEGNVVRATLDRRELVRVQTPQCFHAGVLRRAHAAEPEATDDASLLEALGIPVVVVAGEEHNLKITTRADLDLAEWWLGRRSAAGASPAGATSKRGAPAIEHAGPASEQAGPASEHAGASGSSGRSGAAPGAEAE